MRTDTPPDTRDRAGESRSLLATARDILRKIRHQIADTQVSYAIKPIDNHKVCADLGEPGASRTQCIDDLLRILAIEHVASLSMGRKKFPPTSRVQLVE